MTAHAPTHHLDKLDASLASRDQQAIRALIERLITQHGDHILHLALFGSKATGDDPILSIQFVR